MIYFIQAGEDGPIKIGRTSSVPQRMANLQVGNPSPLRLLGCIPEEHEWHARFYGFNVSGEWFEPRPSLLRFIGEYSVPDEDAFWGDPREPTPGRMLHPQRLHRPGIAKNHIGREPSDATTPG